MFPINQVAGKQIQVFSCQFSSYIHSNLAALILYFQYCLMFFCLSQSSFKYSFWNALIICLIMVFDILYTNINIFFPTVGSSNISPSIQMSECLANTRKNSTQKNFGRRGNTEVSHRNSNSTCKNIQNLKNVW